MIDHMYIAIDQKYTSLRRSSYLKAAAAAAAASAAAAAAAAAAASTTNFSEGHQKIGNLSKSLIPKEHDNV